MQVTDPENNGQQEWIPVSYGPAVGRKRTPPRSPRRTSPQGSPGPYVAGSGVIELADEGSEEQQEWTAGQCHWLDMVSDNQGQNCVAMRCTRDAPEYLPAQGRLDETRFVRGSYWCSAHALVAF
jgi:hypothetical protein